MKHIQSKISEPKRSGATKLATMIEVSGTATTPVQHIATGSRERDLMESHSRYKDAVEFNSTQCMEREMAYIRAIIY